MDVSELVEAFQNIGIAFMSGDRFPIEEFLIWLDGEVRVTSLRLPYHITLTHIRLGSPQYLAR